MWTVFLLACQNPAAIDTPSARYQVDDPDIWASPWPSDRYLRDDGTPDLSNVPNPFSIGLLENYIAIGELQPGWGANSPVHFPLYGPVDASVLPTEAGSTASGSSVFIVDIDASSPFYGERFPVQWNVHEIETPYQPEHLLSVAPVFGFPLRPNTTYAFVLTTDVVSASAVFASELETDAWKGLTDQLFFLGLTPSDIAIASKITVGNPVEEMARMARYVQNNLSSPTFSLKLEYKRTRDHYRAYRTHYPGPLFTTGRRPYLTEGGAFEFSSDGAPVVQEWDDMRLAVCTPLDPDDAPDSGWPVVIYQHGTGGDYDGFCNSNGILEVAQHYGARGLVGLGIDQPLHGPRTVDSASDLAHFNIINPESARTNFRQGALDAIYLARALTREQVVFTTELDEQVALDPERVMFMGHSQGGLTGALAAPWMSEDMDAIVLSGAGAGLAITIAERDDILDFAQLMEDLLLFSDDESAHIMHPIVGLIQHLVDVTDPINYAPYWFSETPPWNASTTNILHFSGTEDQATPYETGRVLAAAARMPPIHPRGASGGPIALRGLDDVFAPFDQNVVGHDGKSITVGFSQWRGGTHHVITQIPEAAEQYGSFLETAAYDVATIIDAQPQP
jgi:predicted esterase